MKDTSTQERTPIVPLAQSFFLPGNTVGVVIIHGYGGSIGDYREFGEQVHAAGFSVYGLCLPGHGRGMPALRAATIADWQQSVGEGIAFLREKNCQNIFIVGSSFGGILALDAARREQALAGLILVNCALSYSGAGFLQGTVLRLMKLFRPDYPKRGLTDAERERGKLVGSTDAWPIAGILSTAAFSKHNVVPNLGQISVPALILSSAHDPVVPVEESNRLMRLLGSSIKEHQRIPVKTHRPFRDAAAIDFMATATGEFIRRRLAINRPT